MRLVELTLTWVAVCLVVPTPSAADQLLFDNGSFSGPQILRIIGPHIIFDDFALPVGSTITGIEWSQHDLPGLPLASVEITFYDGVPSSETLIHAFTVVATTTPNDTGTIYDLEGFDYAVSGLSLHLNAGTYWMGLRSVVSTFGQTWDQTIGNESTIPGRY